MKPPLLWRLAVWGSRRRLVAWLLSPSVAPRLPSLPRWLLRLLSAEPLTGPRSLAIPPLPPGLATGPGIPRDRAQEEAAFASGPLPRWITRYQTANLWQKRRNWMGPLLIWGMRTRSLRKTDTFRSTRGERSSRLSSAELTARVKERAARLGLSAVGVARYDRIYTFGPFLDQEPLDTVIVCVLEQSWAATQAIPSVRSEIAHFVTYVREEEMLRRLAAYIQSLGYRAVPGEGSGTAVAIHYAVEAGLGQLGLNGQLLTPFAGSRCRLMLIRTDMPLTPDGPVDYGIPALCDRCQVCVRRCPSGAITNRRRWHRGVYKAKIKTERCLPMIAQLSGCAVCMKVCPVQRYGLPAVLEEYGRTGRILGKGSDELEGYVWPMDGKRYGPGEKPREAVSPEILHPIELSFDVNAQEPPSTEALTVE